MFWGLSPALDLFQQYQKNVSTNSAAPPETLNILLIGGADSRHVLKTLSQKFKHPDTTQISFFIVEMCIETVAKQLLLLNTALQSSEVMGLVQKTKIFMELYGNTLVRPSVAKYLTRTARDLVKMVTDHDYLNEKMPCVSLTNLKYKERDYLENLLKFWCGNGEFNICDSWDRRLRKSLGVRYDSRVGAFDWDLHMRMHSIGGKQVCNQEYRNFRQSGIAFSWLESEVSKPNRSMVCVVVPNGETFAHYGYFGDMETGPFVSFGLECEDPDFLKSNNGQNIFRATDVTERNLNQIFYEIENEMDYVHQTTNDLKLGPVVMQMTEKMIVDIKSNLDVSLKHNDKSKCIQLDGTTINFMSISMLDLMKYREEYKNLFRIIYFGHSYSKFLTRDLIHHAADSNALIVIENQRFILSQRDKQLEEFEMKIREIVAGIDLLVEIPFNALKDNFIKFIKK